MLFRVDFPLNEEDPTKADQDAMNNIAVLKAGLGAHRVSYSLGFASGPAVVVVDVDSADALTQFTGLNFKAVAEESEADDSQNHQESDESDKSEPESE